MSHSAANLGGSKRPIVVAITGASGAIYAIQLLRALLAAGEVVHLLVSQAGRLVLAMESDLKLPQAPAPARDKLIRYFACQAEQLQVFSEQDWMAPCASGSSHIKGMVIAPCTAGTLGALAAGMSHCLINRSADVCLKEKKPLILLIRETPFSLIHLQNMQTLAQAGATIMPANPGFYHNPQTLTDLADFMVARIFDHLQLAQTLLPEWGESRTVPRGHAHE